MPAEVLQVPPAERDMMYTHTNSIILQEISIYKVNCKNWEKSDGKNYSRFE